MVVELLLQNGAQPELEDGSGGRMPLSRPRNADVVQLLNRALPSWQQIIDASFSP